MDTKIEKKLLAFGLSATMLSGQLASPMMTIMAQEPDTTIDYSDTTIVRSIDTLEVSDVTVDKNFNVSPLYDIENNELLLPRVKGYKIEVFGSDNKPTISLDGKVTRPLVTQTVKLLYRITNEDDGSSFTTEKNAIVKIPAKENEVVGQNVKPQVIPELREWVSGDGEIDLTNARIVLGDEKFNEAAKTFKTDYQDLTGRDIEIVKGNTDILKKGDIYIGEAVEELMLGDEGYYMNIGGVNADKDYIEIKATHNTGALYGTISILQILKQDTTGRNNISKGLIKDYPKFEQRGMMLDVARKWVPMDYLQDLAKQMSYYKLNMLSLHLSDNDIWNGLSTDNGRNGEPEGWFRLESERFPELNQNSGGYEQGEYYTKAEFRNYQYSSMNLGIDVIPELDTPGHALAYTRAWQGSMRSDNAKYLDAKNAENLEKVKALFSEYIEGYNGGEATFVGNNVNIGTDEYKSGTAGDKEAFRAYCDALLKHVKSLGKEPVFWGSLLENNGSTPVTSEATMFAWYRGYADAKASLDAGYKVISMEDSEVYIVPGGGYYSNQFGQAERLYNSWLPNNNTGWAGNPAPDGHPGASGGQFAVWNDYAGNGISVNDISYRIQHNLYVIAQKTWAGEQANDEGKTYNDFKELASILGDAPNADFLYEIDKTIDNNEVIKLDDVAINKITNGVAITNNTNVSENVDGKNGNGLKFNAGSSYLTTELKSAGFGWTTSMWINPSADGILMEGKTGTLRLENGKIKYDVENYTHTFDCNIENNKWTHIALTGTFEGVSLYINGEKFDSLIGKPLPHWNNNSGCNSWSGTYPINELGQKTIRYYETLMLPMEVIGSKTNAITAFVDELNIYNKVLNDQEIANLVNKQSDDYQRANVALNKTVEVGNYHSASSEADRSGKMAVDGNLDSRWEFDLNNVSTNFIKIPLAKDEDVNKIIIKQMVWGGINRITNYKIVAVNGSVETVIIPETTYNDGVIDVANKIATETIELGQTVIGDAIKIYLTPKAAGADDLVNIREIELYGTKAFEEIPDEPTGDYTKIAQSSMLASATSEHPNVGSEGLASMAIDNNTGTWWHTNWNNPVTLPQSITLDLQEIKTIGKYTYLPRPGAGNGTITKFKLETSSDGTNYKEIIQSNWALDDSEKVVEFAPSNARYIRLTALEGKGGFASAAELNVYEVNVKTKEGLQAIIDEAKIIVNSNYLDTSKIKLNKAISDGEALLATDLQEEDIIKIVGTIQEGMKALEQIGDKSELEQLYNTNKDLDPNDYTKSSYNKFKDSLEIIKEIIDNNSQIGESTLKQTKTDFNNNLKGLVSIINLKAWIAQTQIIDELDVTSESYNELKLRLDNAKKVLANDDASLNQVEVAIYRLNVAYDDLKADNTALHNLIVSYKEEDYTTSSWQTFNESLNEAKNVVNSQEITTLTQARNTLLQAAGSLVLRASGTSVAKLTKLVEQADKLDSKDYSANSWQGYMTLINNAKTLLTKIDDINQATIDKAIDDLEVYSLVSLIGDNKKELTATINKLENDKENYTVSSWNEFDVILQAAKQTLNSDNNSEVVTMLETLNVKANALVLRGEVSQLEVLVKQYKVDKEVYTKETYTILEKQLLLANQAINDNSDLSQSQVDQIKTDLIMAFKGLVKIEVPTVDPVVTPDQSDLAITTGDDNSLEAFLFASGISLGALLITLKKRNEE